MSLHHYIWNYEGDWGDFVDHLKSEGFWQDNGTQTEEWDGGGRFKNGKGSATVSRDWSTRYH